MTTDIYIIDKKFYGDNNFDIKTETSNILIKLLSEKTGVRKDLIELKKNQNGKPYIDNNLHFNVSHSRNKSVIAISKSYVGIDLEYMKERDFLKLAAFLGDAAVAEVDKSQDKAEKFYTLWTQYEALVKYRGGRIFLKNVASDLDMRIITYRMDEFIMTLADKGGSDVVFYSLKDNGEFIKGTTTFEILYNRKNYRD